MNATLPFQFCVHPLDVRRGDAGDHLVSQDGLDVKSGILPVAVHGAGADRSCFVFIQPAVQPLSQCYAAVLGQLYILIGFDALVEFAQQLLLRAAVDIAKDGFAALLVAHYNPALPTAVFLLPNHAVARWPALCHDDTPPVQQHNIPQKERPIQGHSELLSKSYHLG